MTYEKLNLTNGTVLDETHLAHIEEAIAAGGALKLKGKKFSLIGDSISTFSGWLPSGYAAYYPKTQMNDVNATWWKSLADDTGMILLKNCAWSGSTCRGNSSSTTNAAAGCSTKRINDLANGSEAPDIVICFIGINDFGLQSEASATPIGEWNSTKPIPTDSSSVTTFSEAYAIMVNKIMKTYPKARVFCCTLINTSNWMKDWGEDLTYPTVNAKGIALSQYNDVIRDVANGLGADIIELTKCGLHYHNLPIYTIETPDYTGEADYDGIHPNVEGMKLLKEKIKNELIAKY